MQELINLITTIMNDWGLLVAFFSAGIVFYKIKQWFEKVDTTLTALKENHDKHVATDNQVLEKLIKLDTKFEHIADKIAKHELELVRNTDQHEAIVKALEGHVQDNRHHDSEVKSMLSIILDRLK